jgi:adenylate cyclase
VKTSGDGLLAEFKSVIEALACAIEVQREIADHNAGTPPQRRLEFRIGVNLGDVILEGEDIFGDGINLAARLETAAEPGGICVSEAAYRLVRGKVDAAFEDLGQQTGKNLPEPMQVYRVIPGAGGPSGASSRVDAALPAGLLLAVLPFSNLSDDPDRNYFSDGITSDLITDLSRFPEVVVIASHTAFAWKSRRRNTEEIARELGVRYVVEGSVQHAGNRVRINVQLVDAPGDRHLWSQRYDRDLEDLFAVQDEIVRSIVATVVARLELSEQQRALRKPTESLAAYDHYLRGQHICFDWTQETNRQAQDHFRKALELDPNYARAYSALAYTLVQAALEGEADDPPAVFQEARRLARKAVAIAPLDFENHEYLGFTCLYCHEFDRSLACYQRALALNPNSADLLADYADTLAHVGRTAEAVSFIARAKLLNPVSPDWYDWVLGIAAFHDGRYDEALAAFTRAANPSNFLRRELVATYVRLDRMDEARALAREVLDQQPGYRLGIEALRPFRNPDVLRAFMSDLRRAGLPD